MWSRKITLLGSAAALVLSTGRAFQHPAGGGAVSNCPPSRDCTSSAPSRTLQAHHKDDEDGRGVGSVFGGSDGPLSRRTALSSAAGAAAAAATACSSSALLLGGLPRPALAAIGGATQRARVSSWPGIEGLEPLYEFKLSIDAVEAGVKEKARWPAIQKRLEQFFKGFIVNEKNFYLGVAVQYMNDIEYDKDELPEYVRLDKEARFVAMEATMKNLESLKTNLGENNAGAVEEDARAAKAALASWFDLVPPEDVKAVQELFVHVKKADVNRDGKLSDEELTTLSEDERETWKRRVAKFG